MSMKTSIGKEYYGKHCSVFVFRSWGKQCLFKVRRTIRKCACSVSLIIIRGVIVDCLIGKGMTDEERRGMVDEERRGDDG